MKPQYHVMSSTLTAGILYGIFHSWSMALSCFLSGIFIDVDHIYDYVIEHGLPVRPRDFIEAVYTAKFERMTLFLHSWEIIFLLFIVTWQTNWNPVLVGVLIGFSHHLILDKLYTGEGFLTYLFMWRWKKDFQLEVLFSGYVAKHRK